MSLEVVQIIEDEPLHARLLDHYLRQARYRTNVAGDGLTGWADIQRLRPSLVLLDLMLPGISGHEVCRRIRGTAGLTNIPVLILSALDSTYDRAEGLRLGADDYISKPFRPREVVARVARLIQQRRDAGSILSADHSKLVQIEEGYLVVSVQGHRLIVSAAQYRVLEYLLARRDELVPLEELISLVWGDREPVRDRQMDILVRSLKTLLENTSAGFIDIIGRIGYRFRTPCPWSRRGARTEGDSK